jgi:hypothetical protein
MSSHLIGCKVRENYSVIASYLKIFRSCKDYWQRIGTLLGGIWRWKKKTRFLVELAARLIQRPLFLMVLARFG